MGGLFCVIFGYSFNDKSSTNQLIFTRDKNFEQCAGEEKGIGNYFIYLNVFHFANMDEKYKLIKEISDVNKEACIKPPFV